MLITNQLILPKSWRSTRQKRYFDPAMRRAIAICASRLELESRTSFPNLFRMIVQNDCVSTWVGVSVAEKSHILARLKSWDP
jgi:hypothetical protein